MAPSALLPVLAQGCAMCKTALEQDGGPGLVQGFYMSMLLLVSLPILMVGTFIYMVRRAGRKAAGGDSAPAVPETRGA